MRKNGYLFIFIIVAFSIAASACSRKITPQQTTQNSDGTTTVTKTAEDGSVVIVTTDKTESSSTTDATPVYKPVAKTTPEYLTLNDAVARKSVDGRLYYDMQNKRYWKNYKDGKYYIYNKNQRGNPDFKPGQ